MVKKFDNGEFKKFLEKEFADETDAMEKAIFSDEDFEDLEVSDEEVRVSYDRLVEKLKKEGVYREKLPKEDKHKVIPFPAPSKSYRIAKVAALFVVCVLGVFLASMASEANRTYFIESLRYLTGNDTQVVVDSDQNDEADRSEDAAIDRIEKELGVKVPLFMYRPTGFSFKSYEANVYAGIGWMEFQYHDEIILLYIDKKNDRKTSDAITVHGEEGREITIDLDEGNIQVKLIEVQSDNEDTSTYAAQWELEDVFYQLSGKMELEQLEEVIKYIKF